MLLYPYGQANFISDTVKFLYSYLMQPSLMPEDRILHGINTVADAMEQAPVITIDKQLKAIDELCQLVKNDKIACPLSSFVVFCL